MYHRKTTVKYQWVTDHAFVPSKAPPARHTNPQTSATGPLCTNTFLCSVDMVEASISSILCSFRELVSQGTCSSLVAPERHWGRKGQRTVVFSARVKCLGISCWREAFWTRVLELSSILYGFVGMACFISNVIKSFLSSLLLLCILYKRSNCQAPIRHKDSKP